MTKQKRAHAFLAPSAAARWLACPAAPALEALCPRRESCYMAEGTAAHALAARALARRLGKIDALRVMSGPEEPDPDMSAFDRDEMEGHADGWANYVALIADSLGGEGDARIEWPVTVWGDDCYGTADCLLVMGGTLVVADYKYGAGVAVEASHNAQLMTYAVGALGAFEDREISRVIIAIFQPRAGGGGIWSLSREELEAWRYGTLLPGIMAALDARAACRAGEHCRWCGAFARCRRAAEECTRPLRSLSDPRLMTPDTLGARLLEIEESGARQWIDKARTYAAEILEETPRGIKGWTLKPGRMTRVITDEALLAERLRSEGVSFESVYRLQTVTALERAAGKKRFATLSEGVVERREGSPTLAVDDRYLQWRADKVRRDFEGVEID